MPHSSSGPSDETIVDVSKARSVDMKSDESSSWIDTLRSIGPAIIIASVVVGPGSILTSSKVGFEFGYSMAWVLVLAAVLMLGMIVLAGRLGMVLSGTLGDEIAARLGRPVAVAIGLVMFIVVAAFQSSNNIAVVASVESLFASDASASSDSGGLLLSTMVLVGLNMMMLAALYGFQNLYVPVERLMKFLVAVMMIGFIGNLCFARPSLTELAGGLIPSLPQSSDWLPLLGLFATTFSVAGAYYQAYLVREKGFRAGHVRRGLVDSIVGVSALGLMTMVIMATSAAVLHGRDVELQSASDVGQQLEPLFGKAALVLFNLGLFAGAISSFLVNAMIGGTVLSDGLGLGSAMNERWPKAFTSAALLIGMTIAIASTRFNFSRVGLIVLAQALTVIAVPLLALALLYLATRKNLVESDVTGRRIFPGWLVALAVVGTLMTFVLASRTALSVWEKISG